MRKLLVVCSALVILGLVNGAIYQKEQHLAKGRVVYLELAPVDPRSLMQGDYMALRFELGNRIRGAHSALESAREPASQADNGHVVVILDENRVASFDRLYRETQPLGDNELLLHYRVRNGRVKFATNAFFFQEGHAERYEPARYGRFRVNDRGEPLLVSMHDADLNRLGTEQPAQP